MSAPKKDHQLMKDFGRYADLGFRFALSVGIGMFLGFWADKKLSTSPLFLILGVLSGATSGFLTLYRAAYPDRKNKKNNATKDS